MKIEIDDQWAGKNDMLELIKRRENFEGCDCTCDKCLCVTICRLAYDGYNTNGDCLYDK